MSVTIDEERAWKLLVEGEAVWHFMLDKDGSGESYETEVLGAFLGRLRDALLVEDDVPDGQYNCKSDRLIDEAQERAHELVRERATKLLAQVDRAA